MCKWTDDGLVAHAHYLDKYASSVGLECVEELIIVQGRIANVWKFDFKSHMGDLA